MSDIIILSNEFLEVFDVILICIVLYFGKIVLYHSYTWITSSQNEVIIRTLFWIHMLIWYKVKQYASNVYDNDKRGK